MDGTTNDKVTEATNLPPHSASRSVSPLPPNPLHFTSQVLSNPSASLLLRFYPFPPSSQHLFPRMLRQSPTFRLIPTLVSLQSILLQNENFKLSLKSINGLRVIIIRKTIVIKQLIIIELLPDSRK